MTFDRSKATPSTEPVDWEQELRMATADLRKQGFVFIENPKGCWRMDKEATRIAREEYRSRPVFLQIDNYKISDLRGRKKR